VFDDHLIVCAGYGPEREFYQVNYTTDDQGVINFTPRAQWIAGSYQFLPNPGAASEDTTEPVDQPAEGGDGMQMSKAMSADDMAKVRDACQKLVDTLTPLLENDSSKTGAPPAEPGAAHEDQPAAQTNSEAGPAAKPPTETERKRKIKLIQVELERSGGIKAHG
jgi:hypothetical protein